LMLWSVAKILIFVTVVAALSLGAAILVELGGTLRIAFAGWEFSLGPLQMVIAGIGLLLLTWGVIKILGFLAAMVRFISGDETAISRYFDRNREKRGYQAISDGLIALASGEGRLALIKAQRAQKYLDAPELTTLLIAQAAEVIGDGQKATDAYKSLLANPDTRFVGIRGLMKQKIAEGDTFTALSLAEKAFALKPRHSDTQDVLLKLQSESADWTGARATLRAKQRGGYLPRDVYKRRDAVLALQQAKGVLDENATIESREAAIAANKMSPDLIPAAAMAARSYILADDKKNAARVLKKAWEAQPHPDLAAAFAEIERDEDPAARLKRFAALTGLRPEHSETKLLLAELNISAENFPAARRALGDLATKHPTQRTLTIMAAIERGEGSDDSVVRGWLTKALTAPRGPQWCCDNCQAIHAQWAPICTNCSGFDTLSWREPPEGSGASSTGTELLPLMVSSPEKPVAAVKDEEGAIDLEAIARGGS
jgi:HemY protein